LTAEKPRKDSFMELDVAGPNLSGAALTLLTDIRDGLLTKVPLRSWADASRGISDPTVDLLEVLETNRLVFLRGPAGPQLTKAGYEALDRHRR
jgi:hypothetical protein